ncbi:hypothetical protein [Streptosporangium sp. LJ11]|uniref:hypothetical protein n=1 Tax=Streptosporangium sp. LJ11 TaxID=3436927 RepID=UPI003F798035
MLSNLSAYPDRSMILWPIWTRQYSPAARRRLRRTILLAKSTGLDVTVEHDGGRLFRMNLLTLTGPSQDMRCFRKRMLRILRSVDRSGWKW